MVDINAPDGTSDDGLRINADPFTGPIVQIEIGQGIPGARVTTDHGLVAPTEITRVPNGVDRTPTPQLSRLKSYLHAFRSSLGMLLAGGTVDIDELTCKHYGRLMRALYHEYHSIPTDAADAQKMIDSVAQQVVGELVEKAA